jgi:3-deoxy-D-manno-octulosonic-acid transferase
MIYFFYDIILFFGFLFYLPVYFKRKKINFLSLRQKLGFLGFRNKKETIWIQVVSVGEVNAIESLVYRLGEVFDEPLVISTTTLTGNRLAKKKYSHCARIIYFPLDVSWIVSRVSRRIKPKIFVAVETEIWPNLFKYLHKKAIPIVIINARISDKAFNRYKHAAGFFKKILPLCRSIGAQNELYRERFIALGASSQQVSLTGNLKFTSIVVDQKKLSTIKDSYFGRLKEGGRLVLLALSTHDPEEEIMVDIYKDLIGSSALTLLLAPRHPERFNQVEKIISQKGFTPVGLSQIEKIKFSDNEIIVVDSIGDLLYLCSLADICFVGGSLSGSGGHNILEPIYFLKPTVFGPSMENFSDIEKVVLDKEASLKVKDIYELKRVLQGLIENQAMRRALSSRCFDVFQTGKHSLDANMQLIISAMAAKGGE